MKDWKGLNFPSSSLFYHEVTGIFLLLTTGMEISPSLFPPSLQRSITNPAGVFLYAYSSSDEFNVTMKLLSFEFTVTMK